MLLLDPLTINHRSEWAVEKEYYLPEKLTYLKALRTTPAFLPKSRPPKRLGDCALVPLPGPQIPDIFFEHYSTCYPLL